VAHPKKPTIDTIVEFVHRVATLLTTWKSVATKFTNFKTQVLQKVLELGPSFEGNEAEKRKYEVTKHVEEVSIEIAQLQVDPSA